MPERKEIFRNISIEKKLMFGFVTSVIIIIVLSFYLYESKLKLHRNTLMIKTNNELRIHVNNLLASLNKLEVDRKRFLLTFGNGDSLEYLKYLSNFQKEFNKLRAFVIKENLKVSYLDSLEQSTYNELTNLEHNYRILLEPREDVSKLLKEEAALFDKLNNFINLVDDEYEQKSLADFVAYQEQINDGIFHFFVLTIGFLFILSVYFFIMMRDARERRKMAIQIIDSKRELDTIIETAPALIFVKDIHKKFKLVNKNFLEFFNTTNEAILNRDNAELISKNNQWLADEEDDAVINDKISFKNIEREITLPNGKKVWLNINKAPLIDGEGRTKGIVGITDDITQRILFQEALIKTQKELEELNNNKNRFFSIIAHDLKGPFTSMLGFSEFLVNDFDELTEEERKEFLKNINSTIKSVLELINNLLDWSRIQFKKIDFTPKEVFLQPIVESVFYSLKIAASNKKILLKNNLPDGIKIFADDNMVETVIRNLVNNSIKFTNENGFVEVSAEDRQTDVQIKITDNGVGMSKEIADNLFKIDVNVSRKGTYAEKGTGLGLLVCKEFIDKHKGNIHVQSEENKGSTFLITLPKQL
jgi:PAS domain S-box-containing protein